MTEDAKTLSAANIDKLFASILNAPQPEYIMFEGVVYRIGTARYKKAVERWLKKYGVVSLGTA